MENLLRALEFFRLQGRAFGKNGSCSAGQFVEVAQGSIFIAWDMKDASDVPFAVHDVDGPRASSRADLFVRIISEIQRTRLSDQIIPDILPNSRTDGDNARSLRCART